MNSVERVKSLCKEKRIPISRLEKDLGFSNGYIGQLRKGVFPSDRLIKIAEYLSVTPDYIMNGSQMDKEKSVLNKKDERDIAKDLNDIMTKLQSKDDGPLNYEGVELDNETIDLLRDAIDLGLRQVKIRNKEKYTPNKYKK